jgi:hypothetical protein
MAVVDKLRPLFVAGFVVVGRLFLGVAVDTEAVFVESVVVEAVDVVEVSVVVGVLVVSGVAAELAVFVFGFVAVAV